MSNNINLPEEYIPFKKIILCSNSMTNGKVPLQLDNSPIILIGKGKVPLLWLRIPTGVAEWDFVVEKNISKNPKVKVLHFDKYLTVYLDNLIILHAIKEDEDTINITHFDLSDFGVLVFGNLNELKIGKQIFSKNQFEGVDVMINIQ